MVVRDLNIQGGLELGSKDYDIPVPFQIGMGMGLL